MPDLSDHVKGVQSAGKYDAIVDTEEVAREIVRTALPHAIEIAPASSGAAYPAPPQGVKAWFQVQPAEPHVGNVWPHVKYADWTSGKKGSGGSWGHLFFPPVAEEENHVVHVRSALSATG
jgi:hypothetical protein